MINTKKYVSANVGSKIKEIRKSIRMSGHDLAEKIGVTQQQISRYESGQSAITIDMLILISRALNVSINQLLADYLISSEYDYDCSIAISGSLIRPRPLTKGEPR